MKQTCRLTAFIVSAENLPNVIYPRIPNNYLTKFGYEDNVTKRVCMSTSISGCLAALSANIQGMQFNVYTSQIDAYKPTIEEVPDCKITNEVWSTEPVKLQYMCKIKVLSAYDTQYEYSTKDFSAALYKWAYEIINI